MLQITNHNYLQMFIMIGVKYMLLINEINQINNIFKQNRLGKYKKDLKT